jgi:pyridoxal phosphate enzyme (YggS family)
MAMENSTGAAERLAEIQARIGAAAQAGGREAADVTLIAVTKTYGAEAILPAIGAGQRSFGENRVQEAKAKWPPLRDANPGIALHLIGPLQSNKVRDAVALFDAIHTVDRLKIAAALAEEMAARGRKPRLFVQVNTGDEPQKAGIAPRQAESLLSACRDGLGLEIDGLMCIPPFAAPPEPHFELLAKLARELGLASLSMGMSADYEAAIRCGATHVRVGSALFGTRT